MDIKSQKFNKQKEDLVKFFFVCLSHLRSWLFFNKKYWWVWTFDKQNNVTWYTVYHECFSIKRLFLEHWQSIFVQSKERNAISCKQYRRAELGPRYNYCPVALSLKGTVSRDLVIFYFKKISSLVLFQQAKRVVWNLFAKNMCLLIRWLH